MLALCTFMLNGPSRDVDQLLEHASNWYSRSVFGTTSGATGTMHAAPLWSGRVQEEAVGFRLATRLTYIIVDVLLSAGNHKRHQAAAALVAAGRQEEALNAAFLTEQAALCYLR